MRKLFLTLSLGLVSYYSNGQEKIGNKIYYYGQIQNSLKGKTLIRYLVNDPKGEITIVNTFKDFDLNVISWNSFFIPSFQYSNQEVDSVISQNDIKTIVAIKINDVATGGIGLSNTFYGNTNSTTVSTSGRKVLNVNLSFEVYNYTNHFSKPVCVVNAEASNFWKGGQRNITTMIVKRVLNAMEDQKAF